jgi:Pyruvate/2-oxoacid:ferredoxin oxidoreductase delta subunit
MAKRGGYYPGKDIPEFYAMVEELFTPDEAAVSNAMPRGPNTAGTIAAAMGRSEEAIRGILEEMADKGLCSTLDRGGTRCYLGPPFAPGIFEYLFMPGTSTDEDRKRAKLIHAYKEALESSAEPAPIKFPTSRVVPIEATIQAGNRVHTYDQMATYVEAYDPISVSACYCRHEAQLVDETDVCGKPNGVCMQFGKGAEFVIERGLGRKVTKEDASKTLKEAADAGLVHCTRNAQEIEFVCNCCSDHCMIIKQALGQPKPALVLYSGFQPSFDADLCAACETCVEACPATALAMGEEDVPEADMDRCFGCGVCVTVCPTEAVAMVERPDAPVPPADRKALSAAVKAHS